MCVEKRMRYKACGHIRAWIEYCPAARLQACPRIRSAPASEDSKYCCCSKHCCDWTMFPLDQVLEQQEVMYEDAKRRFGDDHPDLSMYLNNVNYTIDMTNEERQKHALCEMERLTWPCEPGHGPFPSHIKTSQSWRVN